MKTLRLLTLSLFLAVQLCAYGTAERRARTMGAGMNFSQLENYWEGTKEKRFTDFLDKRDLGPLKEHLSMIAASGFRTVRIPVCFSAWASMEPPFGWVNPIGVNAADKVIGWALETGMNVIIDNHHPELDGSFPNAATDKRLAAVWSRIAGRYAGTDPEKVFFEIRNEPHDIDAGIWLRQAEALLSAIRKAAPEHTLIVGFHDWNSRDALLESKALGDRNLIYTFHYYHPFVFTHQGAGWVGDGIPELRNIGFPADGRKIRVPGSAKNTWVSKQIASYGRDANAATIDRQLREARAWADSNGVPVFLGEFGSFGRFAGEADRCRYVSALYAALGRYRIPSAMWEWNGGFNMLRRDGSGLKKCMKNALVKYRAVLGNPSSSKKECKRL